jgi:hypothetical protein
MDKYAEVAEALLAMATRIENEFGRQPNADIARAGAEAIAELTDPTKLFAVTAEKSTKGK